MYYIIRLLLGKPKPPKEKCPECGSKNTSNNGQGVHHCWKCGHSWRGKDY